MSIYALVAAIAIMCLVPLLAVLFSACTLSAHIARIEEAEGQEAQS